MPATLPIAPSRARARSLLFVLSLCAALALAGCVQPEEAFGEDVIDPGEEVVASARHDHRAAPANHTFSLAEEGAYDMRIRFLPHGEGRCASEGEEPRGGEEALVSVRDPEGAVVAQFSPVQDSTVDLAEHCGELDRAGQLMQDGTWTVEFTGTAPVDGEFVLQRSDGGPADDAPPPSQL